MQARLVRRSLARGFAHAAVPSKHAALRQANSLLAATGYYDLIWTLVSQHYPSTGTYGIVKYPTPVCQVQQLGDDCILEFDGQRKAHPAWGLHKQVHDAMGSEATVIIHNHDDVSVQFSTADRTVRPLIQESVYFYGSRMTTFAADADPGALAGSLHPDTIAVNLLNHGSMVWGRTVPEAFMRFYYLRRCMKVQMAAESAAAASLPLHEPSAAFITEMQARWENDQDPVFGGMVHEYNALLMQHGLFDPEINPTVTWDPTAVHEQFGSGYL